MRKRRWLWVLAAAAAVAAGALAWTLAHPAAGSRGILYRVTGEQGRMYLLGSIHIGSRDMYPFGGDIRQAMAGADTFVFECDTTSAEAVAAVKARMALPQGRTLEGEIGADLYAELAKVCDTLGISPSALDNLRPWAVVNTLAVYSTAAELGVSDVSEAISLGVEEQVRAYADQSGKAVAYLETATEQTDLLEGFSDALTRYLLQSECDAIADPASVTGMDASIRSWPDWWRDGDADAFADQYLATYLAPGHEDVCAEYHVKLVTERNRRMADRLAVMLEDGGTSFVTVGLLHLALPEDSVLNDLEAMGYTVERVGGA